MKKIIVCISVLLLLSSCLRLDDLLYAPFQVEEYNLNDIEPKDLLLPSSFLLDEDQIHEFGLKSENKDGGEETIYAVYLGDTNRIGVDTVIIYCHGNAYNLDGYWQRATLLANVGTKNRYGVLIMDYQGYGKSTGKPYEEGLYKDVDACMKWLKDQGLEDNRTVIYGFSMGSAPATELTSKPRSLTPSKLILEAPFASAEMMVHDAAPLSFPGSFITNLEIDNAEEIKNVSQPFLWLHGEQDDFLSREFHGQTVFNNYSGNYSKKVISPQAGHSNFPVILGIDTYRAHLKEFLER